MELLVLIHPPPGRDSDPLYGNGPFIVYMPTQDDICVGYIYRPTCRLYDTTSYRRSTPLAMCTPYFKSMVYFSLVGGPATNGHEYPARVGVSVDGLFCTVPKTLHKPLCEVCFMVLEDTRFVVSGAYNGQLLGVGLKEISVGRNQGIKIIINLMLWF